MTSMENFSEEMMEIMSAWKKNPKQHNVLDELLGMIIYFTKARMNQVGLIYNNKYISADAALITSYYVVERLRREGMPEWILEEYIENTMKAVSKCFNISLYEVLKNERRRKYLFAPYYKESNINAVVEEAELLFSHELNSVGFVEFNKDSPIMLLGIMEKIKIEQETVIYFKNMFDMLSQALNDYLSSIS